MVEKNSDSKLNESKFDDYSLREVPKYERYRLYNMFLVFSSVYGAIAVIWAGGALGYGLTLRMILVSAPSLRGI